MTGVHFCTPKYTNTRPVMILLPIVVIDFVLLLFALSVYVREMNHVRELRREWNMKSILAILMQSTVCFLIVYAISTFCSCQALICAI
jgi:hypothetical protein